MIKLLMMGKKDIMDIKHDPQVTQYLKNNPAFRKMAWKVHHFRNQSFQDLDKKLLDEQKEPPKKGPQSKGFNTGKNKQDD